MLSYTKLLLHTLTGALLIALLVSVTFFTGHKDTNAQESLPKAEEAELTAKPVRTSKIHERYDITRNGITLSFPYYTTHSLQQADPTVEHAIITIHGSPRNYSDYFDRTMSAIAGVDNVALVAPQFSGSGDVTDSSQLYWSEGWRQCYKSSSNLPWRIPSCEAIDLLIDTIRTQFPNVDKITLAGFSAGGQFANRYAATHKKSDTHFVIGAPSSYMYLNATRPDGNGNLVIPNTSCTTYNDYKYGLNNLSKSAHMSSIGASELINRYGNTYTTYLVGRDDNDSNDSSLATGCESLEQGPERLSRMNGFYQHLSNVYGNSIYETHRMHVINRVGHDSSQIYASADGTAALLRNATLFSPSHLSTHDPVTGTAVATGGFISGEEALLRASVLTKNNNGTKPVSLYFELQPSNRAFTVFDDPTKVVSCSSGTNWSNCSSKVWKVDSGNNDYSGNPYIGQVTIPGLTVDQSYHWKVSACDSQGLCTRWIETPATGADFTMKAGDGGGSTSDTTAPTVPTNVTATALSSSEVALSWTASSDNVAVTGYRVYRDGSLITTVTETHYSDTTLSPSSQYAYRISATDAAGNESAQSSAVLVTTDGSSSLTDDVAIITIQDTEVHRSWKSTSVRCTQAEGATGIITSGPKYSNNITLWKIDFASGCDGWVESDSIIANQTTLKVGYVPEAVDKSIKDRITSMFASVINAFLQ